LSRLGLIVGGVVVAGGVIGAYAYLDSRKPDLSPSGPNRDLAPETLNVYVELPRLADTWTKTRATQSWSDFVDSSLAKTLRETPAAKDLLAAIDEVSRKAEYAVNDANAMKFLGRECSVGVALDAKGGAPDVLVLTKLDVPALRQDLVQGRDLDALWDELQKRTGKCDFAVKSSSHRGHSVATASRGASSFHAALLGDTLAVATDAKLLHAAIDCRADEGAKSLGRRQAFKDDVAALPPATAGFAWYDLDALDSRRASLDAGLASLGAPRRVESGVHVVLDSVRGAHSVAQAFDAPDGDLYAASWTWSKADLFDDKAKPNVRDLFYGEWIFYSEANDLGAAVQAWQRSTVRKKLAEGRFGKWFDGLLADPWRQLETTKNWARSIGPRAGARDDPKEDAAEDEPFGPFEIRLAKRLVLDRLGTTIARDAAFAVDWTGKDGEFLRWAAAVRIDTDARIAVLEASGEAMEQRDGRAVCEEIGGRKVFAAGGGDDEVLWTLVGDVAVFGNDRDFVRQAARHVPEKPLGPSTQVKDAVAALKPGWRFFAHFDIVRLTNSLALRGRVDPSMREVSESLETMKTTGGVISTAAYFADDLSTIEWKMRATAAESKDPDVRALMDAPAREPRVWNVLPETTILHAALPGNGVKACWYGVKSVLRKSGGGLQKAEADFRERMGMDLEKDLLPALGDEIAFAVTLRRNGAQPGMPPVPGVLLEIEARDLDAVRRAVDRALEVIEEESRDPTSTNKRRLFAREARGDAEIVRLDLPEEERTLPITPGLVLLDGSLYLSTDVDLLRDLVETRLGQQPRMTDSPVFQDATGALGRSASSFLLLDWNKYLDQVAVYAPQLAELVASNVEPPEYPENLDDAEWRRRLAEWQKKREEAARAGVGDVTAWIDSLRVIDWIASSSKQSGTTSEATTILKFAK
jgi:hypothetical protein